MQEIIYAILVGICLLMSIPAAVLALEIIAAVTLKRRAANPAKPTEATKIAVIVPAHDEEAGLLPTLNDIKAQLCRSDRLLVVADNCTDNTAEIARAAGAEVIERCDPDRRGKGYALDWDCVICETTLPTRSSSSMPIVGWRRMRSRRLSGRARQRDAPPRHFIS